MGFHRIWHGTGRVFDTVDLFLPDVSFSTQVRPGVLLCASGAACLCVCTRKVSEDSFLRTCRVPHVLQAQNLLSGNPASAGACMLLCLGTLSAGDCMLPTKHPSVLSCVASRGPSMDLC